MYINVYHNVFFSFFPYKVIRLVLIKKKKKRKLYALKNIVFDGLKSDHVRKTHCAQKHHQQGIDVREKSLKVKTPPDRVSKKALKNVTTKINLALLKIIFIFYL